MITDEEKPGAWFVDAVKVWATSPDDDPNMIEWLRLRGDSPLHDTPVAKMPHTCWSVDDLDRELEGKQPFFGPLTVADGVRVAYFMLDGAVVEYFEAK